MPSVAWTKTQSYKTSTPLHPVSVLPDRGVFLRRPNEAEIGANVGSKPGTGINPNRGGEASHRAFVGVAVGWAGVSEGGGRLKILTKLVLKASSDHDASILKKIFDDTTFRAGFHAN